MSTLDNLRKDAKRWLKALRAGDREARARLVRAWPEAPGDPGLRDVQHALAREHGHEHWRAMVAAVNGDPPTARSGETGGATHAEQVATFLEFACWDHHVHGKADHRLRDRAAVRLLAQHPEIARGSLYTAVVCGDLEHVRRLLDQRPEIAAERGGSRGWTPLLYLCYARFSHPPTIANAVAIGRTLLDHGANPNDFYQAGDSRYTALVGAAGEGEQDSPRQPQGPALFELLLERGAEPFDIQVLYNTHFSGDVLWWLQLVEARTRGTARSAAWADPHWTMLDMGAYGSGARFLLSLAIEKNDVALAEWLLTHGAGPNEPPATDPRFSKRSLYEDAVLQHRHEIAALLRRHGAIATRPSLTGQEAFLAACTAGDRDAVRAHVERHQDSLQSPEGLFAAARGNRADVVGLLLDLGLSPDVSDQRQQRALHVAAARNSLEAARMLIERGAEIDRRESHWNATPIGFASHHDHVSMIDLLSRYSRDIWTLAFRGYVDRVRTILTEDSSLARAVAKDGTTPLWWLPDEEEQAVQIVELLLAHGANPGARNRSGRSALDWALKRGMRAVAAALDSASEGVADGPVTTAPPASTLEDFEGLANDWSTAYQSGDRGALDRLNAHYGRSSTWDDVRAEVWRRVRTVREAKGDASGFGVAEARDFVARDRGFGGWEAFTIALARGAPRGAFYAVDREGTIRPTRTLSDGEWDTLIDIIRERRLVALDAGGEMTDRVIERIAALGQLTSLSLGGSRQLTDEGLRHLARMPQLERLALNEYPGGRITDRGLAVLRHLPRLRRFELAWQRGISDAGVANLQFCDALESVDLIGTPTGDGAIAALRGKRHLRRLKSGRHVTDDGIEHLRDLPLFTTPFDGATECSLMNPEGGPHHLTLDGLFTRAGVARLATLAGLSSLSVFGHATAVSPRDLAPLAGMERLRFFGCDGRLCDDAAMEAIGAMPRLRMLMAQGTVATDEGFAALGRSRTLEYLWGRECPNLREKGFAALAGIPTLRGLAVSCSHVGDKGLEMLSRMTSLRDLLPMDVRDEGFRHVGACASLESLWCMYCRDTTDRATEHIAGLRLKRYYAGATQITDRSLEILSRMETLEHVEIYECRGVTDAGLSFVARLPALREVSLAGLPGVTIAGTQVFPAGVHVDYQP